MPDMYLSSYNISNIDVTLRDGGYRNQFNFSVDYAAQHVQMLAQAGIEWIEVGYRNGAFKPIDDIGLTGLSPNLYLEALREATSRPCLCVMAHSKNISTNEIETMREKGVDMIRFCADIHRIPLTLEYVRLSKALGFTVCFNLTRISQQSVKALANQAEQAVAAGADVVYLADSNGSMTPDQVRKLVTVVRGIGQCDVGFHAHDNLGLSMSNSIAAVQAGASFIDSSLRGMGKGAGNLTLELWLGFLNREFGIKHYDYASLLDQVDLLEKSDAESRPMQPLDDLILGLFDLSIDHRERIHANTTRVSQMLANAKA